MHLPGRRLDQLGSAGPGRRRARRRSRRSSPGPASSRTAAPAAHADGGARRTRRCARAAPRSRRRGRARCAPMRSLRSRSSDREVRGHVTAALGAHDRPRAVEHGVAGEQHALLLEEEAQVVRRVARACAAPRRPNSVPSIVSPSPMTRSGTTSESLSRCFPNASDLGAGRLHEARRAAVQWSGCVCVSSTQRTRSFIDAPTIASMWLRVVGPGVDDRDLVDADEVGVRAGPGEGTRVRRDDPAHERRERARHAGSQVGHQSPPAAARCRRAAAPSWSSARPRRRCAPRRRRRRRAGGPATPGCSRRSWSAVSGRATPRRRPANSSSAVSNARQRLDAPVGRVDELDLPAARECQRLGRTHPLGRDRLDRRRARTRGRRAPGATKNHVSYRRGAGLGVIQCPKTRQASAVEHETGAAHDVGEGALARGDRGARRPETRSTVAGDAGAPARRVAREQDAGLLERLADRGDPEREPAARRGRAARSPPRRRCPSTSVCIAGAVVLGVDRAAGEHVRARRRTPTTGCDGA